MMMAPMRPPMMRPPMMRPPMMRPPMMPPRRGPMMGYNTFQPRVFRARPRPRVVPVPMFTPLNDTFQPRIGVRGPMMHPMPPMKHHMFRGKERSNSYDACEDNQECCENQCTKSVCTKCGKEF